MTSGKVAERDGARMMVQLLEAEGLCLADVGYRGVAFQDQMLAAEVLFIRRAEIAEKPLKQIQSTVRERIETVFSQVWSRFARRVRSRSWLG